MATLSDTREIILSGPENYYEWLQVTKSTISKKSWKYVDPEESDECPEPGPYPTLRTPSQGNVSTCTSSATANGGLTTLDLQIHTAQCNEWRVIKEQHKEFTVEETKLRERIQRTVDPTKRTRLVAAKSTREWLTSLRDSYKPDLVYYQQSIISRYTQIVSVYYSHWPTNGPERWLSQWEQLLDLNEEYNKQHQFNWRQDFHGTWKRVSDARYEVDKIREDISQGTLTYHQAASMLRMAWSQTNASAYQKPASKTHAIRAAFPVIPRFDNDEPEPSELELPTVATAIPQSSSGSSRKRAGTRSRQRGPSKKRDQPPCTYCDGKHRSEECFLALGIKEDKVVKENQEVFMRRIKNSAVREKVEALRAYKQLFIDGKEVGGQ